jgi:hypothetical protein
MHLKPVHIAQVAASHCGGARSASGRGISSARRYLTRHVQLYFFNSQRALSAVAVTASSEVSKSVVVRGAFSIDFITCCSRPQCFISGKTPEGHSFRVRSSRLRVSICRVSHVCVQVTLWAFHGMKSLSLGPDDVSSVFVSFLFGYAPARAFATQQFPTQRCR